MKHLFIGGPEDGKRMEVEDPTRSIQRPEYPSRPPTSAAQFYSAAVKVHVYTPRSLQTDGRAIVVFVHDDMETSTAFKRILERYPEPPKPSDPVILHALTEFACGAYFHHLPEGQREAVLNFITRNRP